MKKTYKIDVDCANCANKMEEAARKTEGVQSATVNFMALKMIVEFAEGQDPKAVMEQVRRNCKKVEDDCEIYHSLNSSMSPDFSLCLGPALPFGRYWAKCNCKDRISIPVIRAT